MTEHDNSNELDLTQEPFMIGQWVVDPVVNQLQQGDEQVLIVPKLMETLVYFAQHQGEVISGEQITKAIWKETVVGENSLYNNIAQLRKSLGDTGSKKLYIETIPRKGYRLIAKVGAVSSVAEEQQNIEQTTTSDGQHLVISSFLNIKTIATTFVLIATAIYFIANTGGKTGDSQANAQQQSQARSSLSTIAVFPFDDLSKPDESDYFAQGLSDNLIFRLSHIPGLRVISTTTANAIKQANMPNSQLKSEYGIGAVLKGSIQKTTDSVRVIVQLTNTTDGGILWSTRFDKPMDDVFSIQDAIAQAIGETLRVKLTSVAMPQGVTVEAFDHYLIGRFYWNKRHQRDTQLAIEHFNKAITLSPNYAQAHAGLGDSYIFLNAYGDMPMDEAYAQAIIHLDKALELNPTLAEALASTGQIHMNQGDTKSAEQLFKQAIKANPNYVLAYHWYGILLNNLGRHADALKQHNMAMMLDPLSAIVNRNMAFSQLLNGNKIKARQYFQKSLDLAPIFFGKEFLELGFKPLEKQSSQKAILFINKHYQVIPDMVPHKVTLSLLATSVGAFEQSQKWINQAEQLIPGHPRIIDAQIALKAAQKQWPMVIDLIKQRQQTQPDNHDLYLQLAYAYYLNNDINAVKRLFTSAPLSFNEKPLENNLRWTLLKLQLAPNEHRAEILAKLTPTNDVSIVNAAIYSVKGDDTQAIGILEKMLELGWIEDASQYWWSFNDDPVLLKLKQHPQFSELSERLADEKAQLNGLLERVE